MTVIKLLSSAATIGSGGSAGREGPTAQISAGFGWLLARKMDLSPQDARIAVTVGTGAGIGAIFRAPLGGAVLGTEILYRDDLEPEALLPSLVASIVGFSNFGAVEGFTPIFGTLHTPQFDHPVQLGYYAMLGIAAGLVGRVYARTFYGTTRLSKRLPGAPWIKPAIAGVLVGLIGLAFPEVLSTGYGWLQIGMRDGLPETALWVILLLPLLKIVTTSLSIGSGGSGGIFGPGMVVGGFVGLAVWRVLHDIAPDVPDVPAPFMVVGMIACFGSIAHAPLGLMLMVAEMTGSLALLPPAMLAIGVAAVVVRQDTIYESQIRSRAEAPGHRARFGLPLLGSTPAREVMRRPRLVLDSHVSLAQGRQMMATAGVEHAPVVEGERFAGVVRRTVDDGPPTVGEAVDSEFPTVSADAHLDAALDAMLSAGVGWPPRDRAQPRPGLAGDVGGDRRLPDRAAADDAPPRRDQRPCRPARADRRRRRSRRRRAARQRAVAARCPRCHGRPPQQPRLSRCRHRAAPRRRRRGHRPDDRRGDAERAVRRRRQHRPRRRVTVGRGRHGRTRRVA